MNIKTIGIIGSGTMGSGIASVSALNGFKTIVYDIYEDAIAKSEKNILKGYDKLTEKKKLDDVQKNKAISNLLFTKDFNKLSECELVIEAAIENIELKKELFKKLEEITKEECILATNTSSFSITAISSAGKDKSRVAGMHL